MKLSAVIAPLIAAKVSHEIIMETILAFEAQQTDAIEKRREADRNRQARKRSNGSVTLSHVTRSPSRSHAGVEGSSLEVEVTNKEEKAERAAPKALSDLSAFKADLERDATQEQVEAFAKHRKAKNGQNSAYAATLFRRDAAACKLTVSEAIDTAISRGWLTVKPEYLNGRQAPPQRPPPAETVGSLSKRQLFEQRQTSNAPDDTAGRVVQIESRRLEDSPSSPRSFAISGNLLGRI